MQEQSSLSNNSDKFRIRYEEQLNVAQLQAVTTTAGPLLVIAGAGSGKTRTLTYRVARIVEDGVSPASILLLTSPRKGARQMLLRAAKLLDHRCEKTNGGTMRIPFISLFMKSPFDGLQEHAEKVKECAWAFQQAIECHIADQCENFEKFRLEVDKFESEADSIKGRIRDHQPKGTLMPVDKIQLFRYLREQDKVLDAVEEALDWLSFRSGPGIPQALEKDFFLLVDAVMDPVEEMCRLVLETRKYFKSYSKKQCEIVKDIIQTIRRQEHDADKVEDRIKEKLLNSPIEPITVFHMIRLAEIIGSIADHAENAGDMVRSMVAS